PKSYCAYDNYVTLLFSSRRRHTRFSRDWSSDVCSSDLGTRRTRHVVVEVAVAEMPEDEQPTIGRYLTQTAFGRLDECRYAFNRQGNVVFQVGPIGTLRLGNFLPQSP